MSEQSKKTVKEAQKFYQEVSEKTKKYQQSIPDKSLSEKLKKVGEGASEIVKHIIEKSDHN